MSQTRPPAAGPNEETPRVCCLPMAFGTLPVEFGPDVPAETADIIMSGARVALDMSLPEKPVYDAATMARVVDTIRRTMLLMVKRGLLVRDIHDGTWTVRP